MYSTSYKTTGGGSMGSKSAGEMSIPDGEIAHALKELDMFFKSTGKRKQANKRKESKNTKSNGTGFGGQSGDNTGMKTKIAKAAQEQEKGDGILQNSVEKLRQFVPNTSNSFQILSKLQNSSGWCSLCFLLLRNDSFFDVGMRAKLYRPFLGLILQLARHPSTMEFLSYPLHEDDDGNDGDEDEETKDNCVSTCKQLLTALGSQARVYRQLQTRGPAAHETNKRKINSDVVIVEMDESIIMADLIIETEKAVNSFVDLTSGDPTTSHSAQSKSNQEVFDLTGDDDMVMWIPTSSSTSIDSNKRSRLSDGTSSSSAPGAQSQVQYEAQYIKQMIPHRFAVVDMSTIIASGKARHLFWNTPIGTVANMKNRMNRIAKEMATLSTTLPVEYGSSILVRVDESRMDLAKALIIGPEGTPYENGCFEFDIQLPASYPQAPPAMLLTTTGNGTVRFNPNLYNCGKVCLSLLGTWTGPGWDPQHSTLLQVLISIQALILVPDPFFNEPGYERYGACCRESVDYSKNIRKQCMTFAILEQLKAPSPLFADAITAHFKHKREAIIRQMDAWGKDSAVHKKSAAAVVAALNQLK